MSGEPTPGVGYYGMAMALARAIVEADLTDSQKEAIFRDALRDSPKYKRGEDVEFEVMAIMTSVREHNEDTR